MSDLTLGSPIIRSVFKLWGANCFKFKVLNLNLDKAKVMGSKLRISHDTYY